MDTKSENATIKQQHVTPNCKLVKLSDGAVIVKTACLPYKIEEIPHQLTVRRGVLDGSFHLWSALHSSTSHRGAALLDKYSTHDTLA